MAAFGCSIRLFNSERDVKLGAEMERFHDRGAATVREVGKYLVLLAVNVSRVARGG